MAVPYDYSFDDPDRLEPHPLYARLRQTEPVAWVRPPYGHDCWLATRYDSVRLVMGDPRFSRAATVGTDAPRSGPQPIMGDAMLSLDPPEHTRLRRLVTPAFTAHRVEQLRPRMQQITDDLVDDMARQGPPADLVHHLAFPLPISMICDILGVPYGDRAKFHDWSRTLMSRTAYPREEVARTHEEVRAYLLDLVNERRERPTGDMLSVMVHARDSEGRLSEDELLTMAMVLLVTGHETTSSQIANFTYTLLTNPDQLAWLLEDLSRVPQAVEELLRFVPLATGAPAASGHSRRAMEDVELDGMTVPAGDYVLPAINSANRDDRVFADPDRLDLSRQENPHVAFGYGLHHCLGANLARVELQTAIATLLRRFPGLRLAVPEHEVPWRKGLLVRGPAALPLTW